MSIVLVNTKLKAIIDTLTGSGKVFSVAYDFPNPTPASYPAVMLVLGNASDEVKEDNQYDTMNTTFVVRGVIKSKWTSSGYGKILTILDTLLTEFRKKSHQTLSGDSWKIDIVGIDMEYIDTESSPIIIGDVILSVKILEDTNG